MLTLANTVDLSKRVAAVPVSSRTSSSSSANEIPAECFTKSKLLPSSDKIVTLHFRMQAVFVDCRHNNNRLSVFYTCVQCRCVYLQPQMCLYMFIIIMLERRWKYAV